MSLFILHHIAFFNACVLCLCCDITEHASESFSKELGHRRIIALVHIGEQLQTLS